MTRRMVKRVIKMGGFLLVMVVGALVAFSFWLPVEKLKAPLIQKIEENLNAKVQLENLELSLLPVPSVNLKNLILISTDQSFQDKPIFKMGVGSLSVNLKSLLDKKISLSLNLIQPTVYYRENEDKNNFSMLLKDNGSSSSTQSPLIERLEVTSVVVERGVVYHIKKGETDNTAIPQLTQLDADISHFSLSQKEAQKISMTLSALMSGASQQMGLQGDLAIDAAQKSYRTENLKLKIGETTFITQADFQPDQKDPNDYHYKVQIKADALSFKTLSAFDASFEKTLPPDAQIKGGANLLVEASGQKNSIQTSGSIDFENSKITYGSYFKKGEKIPAKIQWSYYGSLENMMSSGALKGKITWQEAFILEKYEPEKFEADFHLVGNQLVLDHMAFQLFDGKLEGNGVIAFTKTPNWSFDFNAYQVDLNNLLSVVGGFQDVVTGKADMKLALKGTGREIEEIKKTSTGDGRLSVSEGKLSRLNFAKEVLGSSLVEGLNNALKLVQGAQNAPKIAFPRFALQSQETTFRSFISDFKIENGFLKLPDMKFSGDTVSLALDGKSSLDGDLDMTGVLLLSRYETDQWLGDFQGKSALVDGEGRMLVPFKMTGSVLTPAIVPDVGALTEKLKGNVKDTVIQNLQQNTQSAADKIGNKVKEIFQ